MKARRYYNSCVDPGGRLEGLSGKPLLDLLSQFYWNITDFDGSGQMESWKLQVTGDINLTLSIVNTNTRSSLFNLN